MDKKLYTLKEAALMLSMTTVTVNRLAQSGELKRININTDGLKPSYRVTSESIQNFINKQ